MAKRVYQVWKGSNVSVSIQPFSSLSHGFFFLSLCICIEGFLFSAMHILDSFCCWDLAWARPTNVASSRGSSFGLSFIISAEWWQMNWGGSRRETCKESSFGLKGASFEVKSNPHFFGFERKKWRADR